MSSTMLLLNVKTCDDVLTGENPIKVIDMLDTMMSWMDLYPPEDLGNQRYGNKSYRKWYDHFRREIRNIVSDMLPEELKPACVELCAYLMDSFGTPHVSTMDQLVIACVLFDDQAITDNKTLIPDSYVKRLTVEANAHKYLFFDCVNFINQTKTGPFYQHSNQLWNISAVPTWTKVNSGLFKMYEGEVLKKFPVVQHLRFGSLFSFEKHSDPDTGCW
ncbi:hypothetical protein KIN20_005778 [Parelaphostrongylus tenuis]|uniref:Serine/threonine-protein phosphatase 2A activator n=1 Tax=Parelaphostrongylus tenuis TaxID=148309 RepID=A0AAD5QFF3_PARTN|nr:hypothetical protein KIN20_005778 [Parelaphostrongylus tenuis]